MSDEHLNDEEDPSRCGFCAGHWDRPSCGCKNEARHAQPDLAQRIVDQIESELDGRKGMTWGHLAAETLEEMRDDLADAVRGLVNDELEVCAHLAETWRERPDIQREDCPGCMTAWNEGQECGAAPGIAAAIRERKR